MLHADTIRATVALHIVHDDARRPRTHAPLAELLDEVIRNATDPQRVCNIVAAPPTDPPEPA
jgi:hypothetical protein